MHLLKGSSISIEVNESCYPSTGSIGSSLETDYTKDVLVKLTKRLEEASYKVVDCTPWGKDFDFVGDSISYRLKLVNNSNSSLHLSINFKENNGKYVECWVGNYGKAFKFAKKICKAIESLDYPSKGVKVGDNYIISHAKMPFIVLNLYMDEEFSLGANELAQAIAAAIIV